jgi:hypothetical protein
MNQPAANNLPLCVAEDAAEQVAAAVQFILARENIGRISLIAHSWGSMPACELHWSGKMGLIFGCTEAYDEHYGVIGSLGDRFLLYRLEPDYAGQLKKALDHRGKTTKTMRDELASAVVALFATPVNEPEGMTDAEVERLDAVCGLGHPSSRSCRP